MKEKIITAFQDNHRDLLISKKTGQFEDVLYNTGYETAMSFVLGLMGISKEEALNMKEVKEDLSMFERLNKTIIEVIHKVFDESICDFSKWWQDDFETDYGYDTEEELKSFPENELDCVKCDWVYSVADGFVSQTLTELGIISSVIETDSQQVIIEEIYDIVKDELKKKIEAEWN